MPIRRSRPAGWSSLARRFSEFFERRQFPVIADAHGDFRDGLAPMTMTCAETRRVSAAMAYLPAEVRQRANLSILTGCHVERIIFRDKVARGLTLRSGGVSHLVRAREIVLAAGALQSPTLLLRSGVGPA